MILHQRITEKPDKPRVFVARNKIREFWEYDIVLITLAHYGRGCYNGE